MSYQYGHSWPQVAAGNNGQGLNPNQLSTSIAAYLDIPTNSLIIANYAAHNIVRWKFNESFGSVILGNNSGSFGTSSRHFNHPSDVTFDPMGNIYVADQYNHRVQYFPNGQLDGITIAGVTYTVGIDARHLNCPSSLIFDNQLNIYVTDTVNNRVQKFLRY